MTHASLFSGIGGFDLAAEWVGWTNLFNCEIDGFCRKILKYHFPNAIQYGDIKNTDFRKWRGSVNVLSGGFPCQPFSVAGNRKGTADDRYLWPEMLRAIREILPCWVVGENVRGFVSWSEGLVFETVCSDLEAAGYRVQAFIVPACSVGAPHRRDRVWIVAYHNDTGNQEVRKEGNILYPYQHAADPCGHRFWKRENESKSIGRSRESSFSGNGCENGALADTKSPGLQERTIRQKKRQFAGSDSPDVRERDFSNFPSQPPVCSGDDGVSSRLDSISFPAWRRQSVKAYGNAIVPQVALRIFKTINEYEKDNVQKRLAYGKD